MTRLFISYRRSDSEHFAGRVFDRLRREVGNNNLFMDVNNIPLGVDFVKFINVAVSKCDALLAVIGPHWIDAKRLDGSRRLDDVNDFVRIEITSALNRGVPVVPLLLEGTSMPRPEQLPDELKPLTRRNALSVRHSSFDADIDKLVRELGVTHSPIGIPTHLDIAEQLVGQVQRWFEVLAAQGETPRVFTAILRNSSQFSVSLAGLSLDPVKRRDFLIWLCNEYDVVAYAYATRVMKTKTASVDDLVEALDINASSYTMDVFASLRLIRRPDGIVNYVRESYVAREAEGETEEIFWGLQRKHRNVSGADIPAFRGMWARLAKQVHWLNA